MSAPSKAPENTTIVEIAQSRGSAAKTKAGAWKYLLANLPAPKHHRNSGKWQWRLYRENCRNRTGDGRALVLGYSLDDPNTPGRITDEAWTMHRDWLHRCTWQLSRSQYGEICRQKNIRTGSALRPLAEIAGWESAWDLIRAAAKKNVIPASYDSIEFDRKGQADGDALRHELYDFAKNSAIVCIRRTEAGKYGVSTKSKTYMLVETSGIGGCDRHKITAKKVTIPVAKYAKMEILHYGDIIAIARGDKKIKLINATHQIRHGYKAVRVTDDGRYVSVWDGSDWKLGKTRVEAARDEHDSGLYYYQSYRALISAAEQNDIFGDDRQHHRLAVLEVEASGVHVEYGEKLAATRITPIRQIASIF